MKCFGSLPLRLATVMVIVAGAAACTDGLSPTGAEGPGGKPPAPAPAPSLEVARVACSVTLATRAVTCGDSATASGPENGDLVYGGQNRRVVLTSSEVGYNDATRKFTFKVTVRNLLRQAIGTTDGVAASPDGIKVFFVASPVATQGSGVITVDNTDGEATFTAGLQPFYRYVQRLDPFAVSSPRQWQFDVPPTVQSFNFTLAVSSPVQHPTGWIELSHPVVALRRTYSTLLTARVFNQFGDSIPGAAVTWTASNPTLATVRTDSGFVTGHLPGTVEVTAISTNNVAGTPGAVQTGKSVINVTGTRLTWTQGGGNNDWNTPANWSPSVTPVAQDSVTVPVVGSGIYPVLVENEEIDRVEVADGARVELGVFNLTASGSVVSAPFTGGITSSAGRLLLTGTARDISGIVPRLRVTGTYSLTGNVTTLAPLQVQGGRLRNTAYRVRVSQP